MSRYFRGICIGVVISAAIMGLHQSSFGSLDGYCAYLHEPGHCVNGFWVCIVALLLVPVYVWWEMRLLKKYPHT